MTNDRDVQRFSISVARMFNIYHTDEVVKKLGKLPGEQSDVRTLYERMIERGPERFQVKPHGLPAMDFLYEELPNFTAPLDDVRYQLALCADSSDALEITPLLLLGPPGIGKTHFARQFAKLLETGFGFVSMSSLTAGWILSGNARAWKGARPGKIFETLVDGEYANPVIVLDEIDKAGSQRDYDPMGALYSLLEHDTAAHFIDEFAEISIDASQIIWIATANDARCIPDPIMNRMNVYEVRAPSPEEARRIAEKLYIHIRNTHAWGVSFAPTPESEILDRMSSIAPREMLRAWKRAFGNAKLAGRYTILASDIPAQDGKRNPIGFGNG